MAASGDAEGLGATPGENGERGPDASGAPTERDRAGGRSVRLRRGKSGGALEDPEKARAQRRIRAAKLCSTSLHLCPAALVGLFFCGVPGLALCGLAACVCAILGLVGLHRAGPASPEAAAGPGIVRLSVRLAAGARKKAYIGLAVGGVMALLWCALFVLALLGAVT